MDKKQKMWMGIWGMAWFLLWPSTVLGGSCSVFPWYYPPGMVMPELVKQGQLAMQDGELLQARDSFNNYLNQQGEGVFADGVRWALASLPELSNEPGQEFLERIARLQSMRKEYPDSQYAPWALCAIGNLYWDAQWYSEATSQYEEFLDTYPDHSLAGGVMVEMGMGYLEKQQNLEAALIFRRVVAEPKWETYRLKAALGLADATAGARAWKQSRYWYEVVEAEKPTLLRESARASYNYGLTHLASGNPDKAFAQFLVTVNLHPDQDEAGHATNRISEKLLEEGNTFLGLWFAEQAKQHFMGREPARRGQAALTRWVVSYLSHEHSKEEWSKVYQRLEELEMYLSVSWDSVLDASQALRQSPEIDLAEEGALWMGQAYLALGDRSGAMESFAHLARSATMDALRQEGQNRLGRILNEHLHALYEQQAWVKLLKFHTDQQRLYDLIPLERDRIMMIAQAYQKVNLPSKALHWYARLLRKHPRSPLREEILAQQVLLAEELGNAEAIRNIGELYLKEFPQGQWRGAIATVLGMEAFRGKEYEAAIKWLSDAVQHLNDVDEQRYVLRNRARTYETMGKRGHALQDLRHLTTLGSLQANDALRLGDFLFDDGDYEEAVTRYKQVLSLDVPPELKTWSTYRLGLALERMGKNKEAQPFLVEIQRLESRPSEFAYTIRAAASAVLDEFSLQNKPRLGNTNGSS